MWTAFSLAVVNSAFVLLLAPLLAALVHRALRTAGVVASL